MKHMLFQNSGLNSNQSNKEEIIFQSNIPEKDSQLLLTGFLSGINVTTTNTYVVNKVIIPLEIWLPKPDITTFELACCIPYINNYNIFPEEVFDKDRKIPQALYFLRHFLIINHNIKQ